MTIQEEVTLEPLRVVELGNHPGAAYCGLLLAGLGAVVSKAVDTQGYPDDPSLPGGVGARSVYLDHAKLRLAPGDVAAALAEADVVLAGLPAAELTARGWDPDTLRAQYPRLVVAKADDDPTTDLQSQASSGLMALMGEPGRPPLRLPGPQAQYGAGTVLLTGVMFALVHRARTGEGSVVSTTAARALAYLDWKSQIYYADEGRVLVRGSDAGPLVLQCSDGFVGFYYRPEEWEAVKRFVGDPSLSDERFAAQRGRDQYRADLKTILEAFTRTRTKAEVYHDGQAAGIPVGAVWEVAELLDDPQYVARDFLATVQVEGVGPVRVPGMPWTVDGVRPQVVAQ